MASNIYLALFSGECPTAAVFAERWHAAQAARRALQG